MKPIEMNCSHYPGESILIRIPKIYGVIKEIRILCQNRILYEVRYWVNGEMFVASFEDDEIESTEKCVEFKLGFRKE